MADADTTQQTPPAAVNPADIQKMVDDALKAKVGEIQTTTANKVKKEIVSAIEGKEPEVPVSPIVKGFFSDPERFVEAVVTTTRDATMKEVNKNLESKADFNRAYNEVVGTKIESCPDLARFPNEVAADFAEVSNREPNLTNKDKLAKATDQTIKRLGLKVRDPNSSDDDITSSTMAPVGGQGLKYSYGRPDQKPLAEKLTQSGHDYVRDRKERFLAVTGRGSAKKEG